MLISLVPVNVRVCFCDLFLTTQMMTVTDSIIMRTITATRTAITILVVVAVLLEVVGLGVVAVKLLVVVVTVSAVVEVTIVSVTVKVTVGLLPRYCKLPAVQLRFWPIETCKTSLHVKSQLYNIVI